MKKYLSVIVLSTMTIIVFLVLWLTPHIAMNQLEVKNEVGDRSLLDQIKITGILSDSASQTSNSSEVSNASETVQFQWLNHQASFLPIDLSYTLNQAVHWSKQATMAHFPFWNRPNIDRKTKANTLQQQEFWFNVEHNDSNRTLSYSIVKPNAVAYEEYDYELDYSTTSIYSVLSYAQVDQTSIYLLLQEDHQPAMRQIQINLMNGEVIDDQMIHLNNFDYNYLAPVAFENSSQTPTYFAAYVHNTDTDSISYETIDRSPMSNQLILINPQNQEYRLVDLSDLKLTDDDYFATLPLMTGDQLFAYALPKNESESNSTDNIPPQIIAYDFETDSWLANHRLSSAQTSYQLYEGHYYWTEKLAQNTIQLLVYNPVTQDIAYQVDWSVNDKNDLELSNIIFHFY